MIPKTRKFSVTRGALFKSSLDPPLDISTHVLALSLGQGTVGGQQDLYSLLIKPHILLHARSSSDRTASSSCSRLLPGQYGVGGADQQYRIAGTALFTTDRRKSSLGKSGSASGGGDALFFQTSNNFPKAITSKILLKYPAHYLRLIGIHCQLYIKRRTALQCRGGEAKYLLEMDLTHIGFLPCKYVCAPHTRRFARGN